MLDMIFCKNWISCNYVVNGAMFNINTLCFSLSILFFAKKIFLFTLSDFNMFGQTIPDIKEQNAQLLG